MWIRYDTMLLLFYLLTYLLIYRDTYLIYLKRPKNALPATIKEQSSNPLPTLWGTKNKTGCSVGQ